MRSFTLPIIVITGITIIIIFTFSILNKFGAEQINNQVVTDSRDNAVQITEPTITFLDPVRGNSQAPITIIEYSDFGCPFCANASINLKRLLAEFPNDVKLVWKDFPIEQNHPGITKSHEAALCAGKQNKFWEYHDLLFANQDSISAELHNTIAENLNLNLDQFTSCLEGGVTKPQIQKSFQEGVDLEIDGTPYFFINNERFSGEQTFESLKQYVEELLP